MAVEGLKSLERKLKRTIPAKAVEFTRKAMEASAEEIVALMKRLAPKKEMHLVNSINWTWGDAPAGSLALGSMGSKDGRLRITIYAGDTNTIVTNSRGVEFQNAILQEFGTQEMPANPYFYVSWRALRKRAKSRMSREMRKGIREGAK